jgi:ABC-type phosphate/phosphonate transport system substrate-binding protein
MRIVIRTLLTASCSLLAFSALAADKPEVLRIGSSGSLTKELPRSKVDSANDALKKLIKDETGFKSELVVTGSLEKLEDEVKSGKLHLGMFQGYEFAWARQRNPHLKPLAVGINQYPTLVTSVLVKQDSKAADLAALKGQILAMPKVSLEHGKLFVDKQTGGQKPEEFFAKVTVPETVEDAIDDVVDGNAQATIVDRVALETYKRRKPGRFGKLKEIQKSEVFPVPVVAYMEGVLDKETLTKFRDGVVDANRKAEGRRTLELWKMTAFEPVPPTYEEQLTAILKAYPPPK